MHTRYLVHSLLPPVLLRAFRRWRSPPPRRSARGVLSDVAVFPVQEDVDLEVGWLKAEAGGGGPAASLYILSEEVFRLDCLGGDRGHMHFNMREALITPGGSSARIYFEPGTMADHIERAVFHLKKNSDYCIALNSDPYIRKVVLDRDRLAAAAEWMRQTMTELREPHGESGL